MTRGSKEFYEIRDQFEKDFNRIPWALGMLDRSGEGSPNSFFYEDGTVNALFHAYMAGAAFSDAKHRICGSE